MIYRYNNYKPILGKNVFIAPTADEIEKNLNYARNYIDYKNEYLVNFNKL